MCNSSYNCSFQEDGGSPITNYIVEKQDPRTGNWSSVSKFVRGTNYEVLGLTEGKEYKFRVRAENKHGVGEPLEARESMIAKSPFCECSFLLLCAISLHSKV